MNTFDAKGIGQRVRAYRKAANMTAEALASKLGDEMTRISITKLENGHRVEVSTDLLVKLAWALNVPPLALLFPLQDPTSPMLLGPDTEPYKLQEIGGWILGIAGREEPHAGAGRVAYSVTTGFRQLVSDIDAVEEVEELIALNEVIRDVPVAPGFDVTGLTEAELASHEASIRRLKQSIRFAERVLSDARARLGLESNG